MPVSPEWITRLRSPEPGQRKAAIIALGRTGDADALPYLVDVYRNDPMPELRELALKAGRHIKGQIEERLTPPPANPPLPHIQPITPPPRRELAFMTGRHSKGQTGEKPIPPTANPLLPHIQPVTPPPRWLLAEKTREKWHFDRAMDYLVQTNRAKAADELRKLLKLCPDMAEDAQVRLLAGQITRLPPDQAVHLLSDAKEGRAFVKAQPRVRPHRSSGNHLRGVLLLLSLVALAGAIVFFVNSGALAQYQLLVRMRVWEQSVREVNGTQYYVLVPEGEAPAHGWPALVVMHGYGSKGIDMLPHFADFAAAEGVVLIAPSFGDYPYPYEQYTLPRLNDILNQVDKEYSLNSFGAVFYGFSAGGEIATLYARYYSHWVAGITSEGAPMIHPPPTDRGLPYNILYGANDDLRNHTLPAVQNLQTLGYPVLYEIVPGAGHEMTGRGVGLAMKMVRDSY